MLDLVGNIFNNLGAKKMGRENNPFWIDPTSKNSQYFMFVLVFIIESFYLCRTNISSVCFVCTTHQMQTLSNKLDHIPCIETVNYFDGIVGVSLLWTDLGLESDLRKVVNWWWGMRWIGGAASKCGGLVEVPQPSWTVSAVFVKLFNRVVKKRY